MQEQRSRRAAEIAAEALERDAEARAAFVTEACGQDASLHAEVESLLGADAEAGSFLDRPAVRASGEGIAAEADPLVGARIDGFRVLRRLAIGGMGAVYEAQQENPRRRVALKVIRAGAASPEALRRFEHEAHVLARLQHPGIAQVFEAGSFDRGQGAQPFFAMELIEGQPLTGFAEAAALDTRRRLELFARVCDAVHYAHQRGVIHRDLKPGNVLVGREGGPKILDFGVARVTGADIQTTTLHTQVGELIGTVPYMSPEQVLGDADQIDIRSDVYALGVMLYELLSGRLPHDLREKTIPEAARIIREEEITPLSSVNRVFRGDLETVVAKALDREPQRRYQSAAELGADVRRYLNDEPITARPPSAIYQLRKFARRNKALMASSAAILLVLLVGGAVSMLFAIKEGRARRTAEERLDLVTAAEGRSKAEAMRAGQVAAFLESMLERAKPAAAMGADTSLLRLVLDDAAKRVDTELAEYPDVEASIRMTIGSVYHSLDEYELAHAHVARALELRRARLGDEHAETLSAIAELAALHRYRGQYDEAEHLLVRGLETSTRVLGEEHTTTLVFMNQLGVLYKKVHRSGEALELFQRVAERAARSLGEDNTIWLLAAAGVAGAYHDLGRLAEAEQLWKKVVEIRVRIDGEEHPETLVVLGNLAAVYWSQERYDEAEAVYVRLLEARKRIFGERHTQTLLSMHNLAGTYQAKGSYDKAEPLFVRTLELRREILGDQHPETLDSIKQLGVLYWKQARYQEAAELFAEELKACQMVWGHEHPQTLKAMSNLAAQYEGLGRGEEAEAIYLDVLETRRSTLGEEHRDTLMTINSLGALHWRQGRFQQAAEMFEELLEVRRRVLGDEHSETLLVMLNLAAQYENLGRPDEAEVLLLTVHGVWSQRLGAEHPRTLLAAKKLAGIKIVHGQYSEAELALVPILEIERQRLGERHPETGATAFGLGKALAGQGRHEEAEPLLALAEEVARQFEGPGHWRTAMSMKHHGATLGALGRQAEAEALLQGAQVILEAKFGLNDTRTQEAVRVLAELYESWGRPDMAARYRAMMPVVQETSGAN